MKKIVSLLILFILFIGLKAQPKRWYACDSSNSLYSYRGRYIDLENFKWVGILEIPTYTFKKCSGYDKQFKYGYQWQDNFNMNGEDSIHSINSDNAMFELIDTFDLRISIRSKQFTIKSNRDNDTSLLSKYSNAILLEGDNWVDHFVHINNHFESYYIIQRYNKKGEYMIGSTILGVGKICKGFDCNDFFSVREVWGYTGNQLFFHSRYSADTSIFGTYILDLDDHQVSEYPFFYTGYAYNSKNTEKISGLFYEGVRLNEDSVVYYMDIYSSRLYQIPLPPYNYSNRADYYQHYLFKGIIKDSLLVITSYSIRSPGCSLFCYNMKTGSIVWDAEICNLPKDHYKCDNRVYLSLYKNKVVLENIESYGTSLQIFDLTIGNKLLNEVELWDYYK